MDAANSPRCPLSHPSHPHNLSHRYGVRSCQDGCFTCGVEKIERATEGSQSYCTICGVEFHGRCDKLMRKITHPYHLQHPLTLTYRNPETRIISSSKSNGSKDERFEYVEIDISQPDIIFNRCSWCGTNLNGDWFYRCSICTFCLDLPCARSLPPLTIANSKGHHHSLSFLPRPLLVPCDACGLVNAVEPSYACFQCSYMAHQSCIDLPRVIKITRHPHHRLHYIPYGSPVISTCRVCYKKVDIKYGQYSCDHEGCVYVAHSKCATDETVWDGRELEWEPEEPEEDVSPFKNLGDGFIEHFGHEHHRLKLKKHDDGGVVDIEKLCDACVYPIVSHSFYDCEECHYSLHEVCAGLPKKMDHALHNHTLLLDPSPQDDHDYMDCSVCLRVSTGFRYTCSNKDCRINFLLDVRCVSIPECFTHKSHDGHPVFISTTITSNRGCKRCKKRCSGSHVECPECEFALCYACATIPHVLHYKYDRHPLTLSYGEEGNADESADVYWCEVCEK